MEIIFRSRRMPDNNRLLALSFAEMQVLDGNVSCADPEGVLRGALYRLWFRPLRLSLLLGVIWSA
jgi:hypothetical protein